MFQHVHIDGWVHDELARDESRVVRNHGLVLFQHVRIDEWVHDELVHGGGLARDGWARGELGHGGLVRGVELVHNHDELVRDGRARGELDIQLGVLL